MSRGGDLPTMLASNYVSNAVALNGLGQALGLGNAAAINSWQEQALQAQRYREEHELKKSVVIPNIDLTKEPIIMASRVVQVFIADTNPNLTLKDQLLYQGERFYTDLSDQELFYELDIKGILEAHNAKRTRILVKTVKDRAEYLEPARVRDLKMTVVTIATF